MYHLTVYSFRHFQRVSPCLKRVHQKSLFATAGPAASGLTFTIGKNKYALDGKLTPEKLAAYEKQGYLSWLYLCTDQGADFG